ncbi:hypothetical protein WA026_018746 [Henosepilachna vigintioctopunctata]|uniref:Uncharacterized protein n=1 Tax=Henosepilachna vigintioctopunctata TaxID=420089 RepID=A0AAW1TY25_9CUCU
MIMYQKAIAECEAIRNMSHGKIGPHGNHTTEKRKVHLNSLKQLLLTNLNLFSKPKTATTTYDSNKTSTNMVITDWEKQESLKKMEIKQLEIMNKIINLDENPSEILQCISLGGSLSFIMEEKFCGSHI